MNSIYIIVHVNYVRIYSCFFFPSYYFNLLYIFGYHMICSVSSCPLNGILYAQTGDLSKLPLLCHYPVKVNKIIVFILLMSFFFFFFLKKETNIYLFFSLHVVLFLYKEKKNRKVRYMVMN